MTPTAYYVVLIGGISYSNGTLDTDAAIGVYGGNFCTRFGEEVSPIFIPASGPRSIPSITSFIRGTGTGTDEISAEHYINNSGDGTIDGFEIMVQRIGT